MYFPYMFGKKDKNKHSFIKLIFTPLAYIQKYQIIFQKKRIYVKKCNLIPIKFCISYFELLLSNVMFLLIVQFNQKYLHLTLLNVYECQ